MGRRAKGGFRRQVARSSAGKCKTIAWCCRTAARQRAADWVSQWFVDASMAQAPEQKVRTAQSAVSGSANAPRAVGGGEFRRRFRVVLDGEVALTMHDGVRFA